MKKLLLLAVALFAVTMVTSTPASAQQVFLGIGHHSGVRVIVGGPVYAPGAFYGPSYDYCGYDAWGRPIICQPQVVAPFYGYDYGYGYYGRRYYAPRDFRNYGRDYGRDYGRGNYRGGNGGGHPRR